MNDQRVLFMGRKDDSYSEELFAYLQQRARDVVAVWAEGFGSDLDDRIADWTGDFIFCFRSHFILRQDHIAKARIAAINFHPGPPEYRGTGCVNWALYDGSASFGSTAHLMTSKVDSGDILDVRRFPIGKNEDVEAVLARTHVTMLDQAHDVIGQIAQAGSSVIQKLKAASINEGWSGPNRTMKDLKKLKEISADIDPVELEKIIRATKFKKWRPFIYIHGKKFILDG